MTSTGVPSDIGVPYWITTTRSQIPVISAVGHEIDYTISDFVADFRAPTPSAAAEQVIVRKQELIDRIENFYSRARLALLNKIELWEHKLQRYVFRDPTELIQQYQQRIDELVSVLQMQLKHLGEIHQERFKVLTGKLSALSPLNILGRGYSITFKLPEEQVISKAGLLKAGARIKTRLAEGALISKVEKVSPVRKSSISNGVK